MDSLVFKCWTICVPRCCRVKCNWCVGRNRRVAPARIVKIVVPKGSTCITTSSESSSPGGTQQDPRPSNLNLNGTIGPGETNLYFQSDEGIVTFCPSPEVHEDEVGVVDSGRLELNGSNRNLSNIVEETNPELWSTLFVKVGNSKILRVLHLELKPPPRRDSIGSLGGGSWSGSQALALTSKPNSNPDDSKDDEEDEDDEEYWFTRWSKRPQLKNPFKPKAKDEGLPDLIGRRVLQMNSDFNSSSFPSRRSSITSIRSGSAGGSSKSQLSSNGHESPKVILLGQGGSRSRLRNPSFTQGPEINDHDPYKCKVCGSEIHCLCKKSSNGDDGPQSPPPAATSFGVTNDGFQIELDEDTISETDKTDQNDASIKIRANNTTTTDSEFRSQNGTTVPGGPGPPGIPSSSCSAQGSGEDPPMNGSSSSSTSSSRSWTQTTEKDDMTSAVPQQTKKPILFFIHGLSESSEIWSNQLRFFYDLDYEAVCADLLGHGMSSAPSSSKYYTFDSLVEDLVCVFDHFVEEDRQTVIIGHGYGACLGTVLSRIRPNNVQMLISISGGGPTPIVPPGCFQNPLLPFSLHTIFAKKRRSGRFDNPDLTHVLPSSVHQKLIAGQLWLEGDTTFHRRIPVPTLLVYGMRDKVVSLIEECEMERTIPRAFLELIPTAGHMVMCDEPKKLNRMILKFIDSWSSWPLNPIPQRL